ATGAGRASGELRGVDGKLTPWAGLSVEDSHGPPRASGSGRIGKPRGSIMKINHQIPLLAVLLLALPLAFAGCGRSDGGAQGESCSSDGDCSKSTTCVDGVCQVP